jgi:hypothetical protein
MFVDRSGYVFQVLSYLRTHDRSARVIESAAVSGRGAVRESWDVRLLAPLAQFRPALQRVPIDKSRRKTLGTSDAPRAPA